MLFHIRAWNRWRKNCLNNRKHKILVLLRLRVSPTLEMEKPFYKEQWEKEKE